MLKDNEKIIGPIFQGPLNFLNYFCEEMRVSLLH